MDGVASCTEDSVDDCSFSTGGFSIDEPSNRPLKLSYGVQAKRTGTDRASVGTRDPFRVKSKRQ